MFYILVFIAVLIIVGYFIIVYLIGPRIILHPARRVVLIDGRVVRSPAEFGLNYEDVEIRADDGAVLKGWLIKSEGALGCNVIYLHGIHTNKTFGIKHARFLAGSGFNVLLVDMRAHGESGGEYCTYGYIEKFDVVRWIDFLKERYPDFSVALFGISMGGAIALQTAAIDGRVCAVISEGGFANFWDIALDHQELLIKFRSKFIMGRVLRRCESIANFKSSEISPIDSVRKLKSPVLYIHGRDDRQVKYQYAELLHKNTLAQSELILVDGAGHTNSWEVLGEVYVLKILNFLKKNCCSN
jgi:hypothetical protein